MPQQFKNSTLKRYTPLKRKTPIKKSTKPIKPTPLKRRNKPIKKTTYRESRIKAKLSKVKDEIELKALQDGTYYCQGCGGTRCNNTGLDKCHILPIGRYKHLELVEENIVLMGRKCHEVWDSGSLDEKKQLLNYEYMLSIALKYDELFYNRLLNNNPI